MKIVNRNELAKMPNGTLFSCFDGYSISGFEIITGSYGNGFNGTLSIEPSFNWDSDEVERITNWCTVDTTDYDFDENSKFVVYSKDEIKEIIQWLQWSIGDSEAPDMEKYFYKDMILNEKEVLKISDGHGLLWG